MKTSRISIGEVKNIEDLTNIEQAGIAVFLTRYEVDPSIIVKKCPKFFAERKLIIAYTSNGMRLQKTIYIASHLNL